MERRRERGATSGIVSEFPRTCPRRGLGGRLCSPVPVCLHCQAGGVSLGPVFRTPQIKCCTTTSQSLTNLDRHQCSSLNARVVLDSKLYSALIQDAFTVIIKWVSKLVETMNGAEECRAHFAIHSA